MLLYDTVLDSCADKISLIFVFVIVAVDICFSQEFLCLGASSGIGKATSELFSKLGANLALCGRNVDNLNAVAENCRKNNSKVTGLC